MRGKLRNVIRKFSLFRRFLLAGFVIMVVGMIGIGLWVEQQIQSKVVHNTGATTALYVDSFVSPFLQDVTEDGSLTAENTARLSSLIQDSPMGQKIVAFKVWDISGKLLFTTGKETVGKTYPMGEGLVRARSGEVSSEISNLEDVENALQGIDYDRLLETYSPVWQSGTDQIIAVAEFYQTTEELDQSLLSARRQSWVVVGIVVLLMYLFLSGFVRQAGKTIDRQQVEMGEQVNQLSELLEQNRELHNRVRKAAASVALLNESFLRRIGSEMHDGPAQDLGLAVLKLDAFNARIESGKLSTLDSSSVEYLTGIQSAIQQALTEMRGIAAGLSVPQLNDLSLRDTILRAINTHERRTGTNVEVGLGPIPEQASLPLKITIFRVLQEGLNNSFRHALGLGQKVEVRTDQDSLIIEISDNGPGFNPEKVANWEGHLGLNGMRERVESMSGRFTIDTALGKGTRLIASLPCSNGGSLE